MEQASLKLSLNLNKTRKQVCLEQMGQVLPRAALVELMAPYCPEGKTGRAPFSVQTMLRIHLHNSNGSPCPIRAWKKPSFTPLCCASLPS